MLIFQSLLAPAAASSPVAVTPYPLYAWGFNSNGQLGVNDIVARSYPVQVQAGTSWKSFSVSENHTAAVKSDGTLWTWGNNEYGQLGIGIKAYRRTDLEKLDNSSWSVIRVGWKHTVGIKTDGSLWAWGTNTSGQLGLGDMVVRSSPVQVGTSSWTAVRVGDDFTIAIKLDGSLWTWGLNTNGSLGNGLTTSRSSPIQVGAKTTWSKIDAATEGVVASTSDNSVYVWGRNALSGSAGNNQVQSAYDSLSLPRSSPVAVAFVPFSNVIDVAGGFNNILVIDDQYKLWAWGSNTTPGGSFGSGQLGTNDTLNRSSPVLVSSTGSWTAISSQAYHNAAIKSDGSLWTWGWNSSGQLGLGDTINRSSPIQVGSSSWTMVSAGENFTVALNINGQVFCWGANGFGQLGTNSTTTLNRSSPVQIASTSSFNIVSAGANHVLARTINNKLWVWGYNGFGQLGLNLIQNRSSPTAVLVSTSWTALAAGTYHSTGIQSTGGLYTWGYGGYGQLGTGTTIDRSNATQVGVLTTWTKIAPGGYMTQAMTTSAGTSTVYHFGNNGGAAGIGSVANTNSPVAVYSTASGSPTPHAFTSFLASSIITPDGTLIASGENTTYGLALVDTPLANTTFWRIAGHSPPGTINSVSVGQVHAAVVASNKLWSWGMNDSGAHMGGNTIGRSRAVLTESTKNWSSVEAGYYANMGITTDGLLWSSGYNGFGVLGVNDTVDRSSPTQVGSSSWSMVSLSKAGVQVFAAGVTSDSKLWGWGRNYDYLPLGPWGPTQVGALSNRSAPLQIGTATNWSTVVTSAQNSTSGNDALIVGVNSAGEAYWQGNGTDFAINDLYKESPVQVGYDSDWDKVSAGGGAANIPHTFALKTNKTLWSWGSNTYGNLGLGLADGVHRSSPTQVTGGPASGSWNAIAAGYNFAYGVDTSNQLWTWGYNYTGGGLGLGVATATNYNTPQRVTKARSFTFLEIGKDSIQTGAVAFDSLNDEYWSWGGGTMGVGGMQSGTVFSSPSIMPSSSWKIISIGQSHSVGLKTDGSMWTWGSNNSGQLGTNSTLASRTTPGQIMPGSSFSIVSAGASHSAAIDVTGRLLMWGLNNPGILGLGDGVSRSSPHAVGADKSWTIVSAGVNTTAAVTTTGELWAWGNNTYGQLGENTDLYISRSSPVQVAGASNVVYLDVGLQRMTYIDSSGRCYYTGNDIYGLSARGTNFDFTLRQTVPFRETLNNMDGSWNMVAMTSTGAYTLANASQDFGAGIKSDGSLWTWGGGSYGQLGNNNVVDSYNSAKKIGDSSWTFVAAAISTAAAIDANGRLFTWGDSISGKTAVGDISRRSSPTQVAGSWSFVTLNDLNGAGIQTNGTLWTWGSGAFGKIGNVSTISRSSPVQVGGTWTSVAIVSRSGAAMLGIQGGKVYGWGAGGLYMIGGIGSTYTSTDDRSSPVAISAITYDGISATAIAGSVLGAMAYRLSDGTLWTWGDGTGGALGNNSQANVTFPSILGQTLSWSNLTVGTTHAAAVRSDGTLWVWGENVSGQLGLGDTFNRSSPTQVGALTDWVEVVAGSNFTLARKTGGTLWSWGSNLNGQLGSNTTVSRSSPVQVGTSSWSAISAGNTRAGGISAFRLFMWGSGTFGALGLATDVVSRSSPVQVGTSSWTAISVGEPHALAIRLGGSLFAWGGDGGYGNLGLNSTIDRSSPVQIGTSSWSLVSAGYYGSMGITTAGSLWAWGSNSQGRLGIGNDANRSNPTQVGALTGWTALGKSIVTEVNSAARGFNLYAMGAIDTAVLGRSSPVLVGVGSWKNIHTAQYVQAAIYNDSMILTEGFSGSYLALGNNSTTSNPWNTSSRVITPLSRGHRAWIDEPVAWTNNITMHQDVKATKSDGTLWMWGSNGDGTLGDGTLISKSSPVQIGTDTDWNTGSTKFFLNCGATVSGELKTNGAAYAWGDDSVGSMLVSSIQSPTQILGSWTMVKSANYSNPFMGGLKTDGTIWSWGEGINALGHTPVVVRSSPTQIGSKSNWTFISVGGNSRMGAIGDSGQTVYVWGSDLGAWTQTSSSSPVALFADVMNVRAAYPSPAGSWSLVLSTDGSLYGIGTQKNGEFGDGGIMGTGVADLSGHIPRKLNNGSWTVVATGNSHTLGIKSDGSLWTWGQGTSGQLGTGDNVNRSSPVVVLTGKKFISITGGGSGSSHAIANNGIMWAFGAQSVSLNQLGVGGLTASRSFPQQVGEKWNMIKAGLSHVAAIDAEGGLWVWGLGTNGCLGLGDTSSRNTMTKINESSWSFVSCGQNITMAITTDGKLWTWGTNTVGQLGNNNTLNRSSPVQVTTGPSSWTFVDATLDITLGISSNGTLWAWGRGLKGALGDNSSTSSRSTPIQISSSNFTVARSDWTNQKNSYAIAANGDLYAWGDGAGGGIPNNGATSGDRSTPTFISGGWRADRDALAAGGNGANFIISSNGGLYAWGSPATAYLLGLNLAAPGARSSPTQLGTSSWTAVYAEQSQVAAITSDNRLFMWGVNTSGALGTLDTLNRSSPTQVSSSQSFTMLALGTHFMNGVTPTNDRYYWGALNAAFTGLGATALARSSPYIINSGRNGSWIVVTAGTSHVVASRTE